MSRAITVRYRAVDGYRETRKYLTVAGASAYARKWVGAHPDLGTGYAVSADGIGTIVVLGATLSELFPGQDRLRVVRQVWTVVVSNDEGDHSIEGSYTSEKLAAAEAATLAESLVSSYGLTRAAIDASTDGLTIELGELAQIRVKCSNLYEEQS